MKKIVLIVALFSMGVCVNMAHAQNKLRIGFGFNYAMYSVSEDIVSEHFKYDVSGKGTLRAEVDYEYQFSYLFSVRTGLAFSQQSFGVDFAQSTHDSAYGEYRLGFLELPIHFVTSFEVGKKSYFYIGAGPVFSMGVRGFLLTDHFPGQTTDDFDENEIEWDGNASNDLKKDHLKRFNAGLNFIMGYQLAASLYFQVNYHLGLTNIAVQQDNKMIPSYVGATIGFRLIDN